MRASLTKMNSEPVSRWDILLSFRQTRGLTMWIFFSPIYRMLRREQFDRHVNSSLNWIKTDHSEEMDSNEPHRWFLSKFSRTCSTSFMPSKSFEIYMIGASYTEYPVYRLALSLMETVLNNILRSEWCRTRSRVIYSRTRKGASSFRETRHFLVSTPDCGESSDVM